MRATEFLIEQEGILTESEVNFLLENDCPTLSDPKKQRLFKTLDFYNGKKTVGSPKEKVHAVGTLDKLMGILRKFCLEKEYQWYMA